MMSEALLSIIPLCAPDVAPNTIAQIIWVESKGNPLAINVNNLNQSLNARNIKHAVQLTQKYIEDGYSVDVGLMQINSTNFASLGYNYNNLEQLFEPCNNIYAGSIILKNFYQQAKQQLDSKAALKAAISAYNTGSYTKGISNGYVTKVYSQVAIIAPQSDLSQSLNAPSAVNIHRLINQYKEKQHETE